MSHFVLVKCEIFPQSVSVMSSGVLGLNAARNRLFVLLHRSFSLLACSLIFIH